MISRLPQACAYFCNVAKDGEYFVPRNDDSSRETALLVVPIRAANSSRVSPEFVLAVMSDESAEYSSSEASHALENPERDAFARSISLVTFNSIGLYRSTMVLFFLHAVLQNLSRLEPALIILLKMLILTKKMSAFGYDRVFCRVWTFRVIHKTLSAPSPFR